MSDIIVILHVLAAILLLGPIAVSTSMFAPTLRGANSGDELGRGGAHVLAKMTRIYGYASLLVPLFGMIGFFTIDGAMQNYNFHAAIAVAVIAWALLIVGIIPLQRKALILIDALSPADPPATEEELAKAHSIGAEKLAPRIAMFSGIFNLLWVITLVLMFVTF